MELFGVGLPEIGLIAVIALVIVGPNRFPEVAREAARWYRTLRGFSDSVMEDVRTAMNELEQEVTAENGGVNPIRELSDLRREFQGLAQDAGARVAARYRHETIRIPDMDCGDCAQSIEHVMGRVPGVLSCAVSYGAESMHVEFDSTRLERGEIVSRLRSMGYEAQAPEAEQASWIERHDDLLEVHVAVDAVLGIGDHLRQDYQESRIGGLHDSHSGNLVHIAGRTSNRAIVRQTCGHLGTPLSPCYTTIKQISHRPQPVSGRTGSEHIVDRYSLWQNQPSS